MLYHFLCGQQQKYCDSCRALYRTNFHALKLNYKALHYNYKIIKFNLLQLGHFEFDQVEISQGISDLCLKPYRKNKTFLLPLKVLFQYNLPLFIECFNTL